MSAKELALAMTAASDSDRDGGRAVSFESVLEAFERPVLRLCYRLLGNLPDAQDAAQEVFLRAYKNMGLLNGRADPGPWLYRVALNLCRDRRRRAQPSLGLDGLPESRETGANPEEQAREAERKRMVMEGLAQLTDREREALVLRELECVDTRQVAAIMGIAEESVRSLCSLGRARLKQFLEGRLLRS